MRDIENAQDVKMFLDAFYKKVKVDDTIGYIFNDVASINWDDHMPKIYAFWESILMGKPGFSGDIMGVHRLLDQKERLTKNHFDQWIRLFEETLHEMYAGAVVNEAINRAKTIRRTMEFNLINLR